MLSTHRPYVNKREAAMVLALIKYTILALEEQIDREERGTGDMEYLSGLYGKMDEAKERARFFKALLS